jgi:hypothetical protein
LCGIALENEAVEGVERQETLIEDSRRRNLGKHTPFGRVRINVVEMLEVRGIFKVAERRDAVTFAAVR